MRTSMRLAIGLCVALAAGCAATPPAKHLAPSANGAAGAKGDALYRALGGTNGIAKVVDAALVCGLPPKEFSGEQSGRARAGHIPGSISVPAGRLVDRESNAFLTEEELREKFAPVLDGERIVAYCAGGIAATSDALALTLLGHHNVAVYDGSLNEWAADPRLELVVGA